MDGESHDFDTVEPQTAPSPEASAAAPVSANLAAFLISIDALHFQHFHGTRLGNETDLWNLVYGFKEAVKEHALQTLNATPGAA